MQLKFTAPPRPGIYSYQVCLRSDSYLGLDQTQDIKLDVKEAREIPTEHPQWETSSDEEEEDENEVARDEGDDSEYTTDDEVTDDSGEELAGTVEDAGVGGGRILGSVIIGFYTKDEICMGDGLTEVRR